MASVLSGASSDGHLRRKIDRFARPFGRSGASRALLQGDRSGGLRSIRELMIRMPIVGYCFGVRSERRLCEEVHLNLAHRWFCRLGLDGDVPDHHSTFSKKPPRTFSRETTRCGNSFETVLWRAA